MRNPVCLLTLFLFVLLYAYGCTKSKTTPAPYHPDYSSKIGGTRLWLGVYTWKGFTDTVQSSATITDNTSAVLAYSSDTVKAFGGTIGFTQWDSTGKTITYGYHDEFMEVQSALTYYYEKDSMVYHHSFWHHGIGNALDLHTH
jgi:hypothetical protein